MRSKYLRNGAKTEMHIKCVEGGGGGGGEEARAKGREGRGKS